MSAMRRRRVPVVDDEAKILDIIRGYLEHEGFELRLPIDSVGAAVLSSISGTAMRFAMRSAAWSHHG